MVKEFETVGPVEQWLIEEIHEMRVSADLYRAEFEFRTGLNEWTAVRILKLWFLSLFTLSKFTFGLWNRIDPKLIRVIERINRNWLTVEGEKAFSIDCGTAWAHTWVKSKSAIAYKGAKTKVVNHRPFVDKWWSIENQYRTRFTFARPRRLISASPDSTVVVAARAQSLTDRISGVGVCFFDSVQVSRQISWGLRLGLNLF